MRLGKKGHNNKIVNVAFTGSQLKNLNNVNKKEKDKKKKTTKKANVNSSRNIKDDENYYKINFDYSDDTKIINPQNSKKNIEISKNKKISNKNKNVKVNKSKSSKPIVKKLNSTDREFTIDLSDIERNSIRNAANSSNVRTSNAVRRTNSNNVAINRKQNSNLNRSSSVTRNVNKNAGQSKPVKKQRKSSVSIKKTFARKLKKVLDEKEKLDTVKKANKANKAKKAAVAKNTRNINNKKMASSSSSASNVQRREPVNNRSYTETFSTSANKKNNKKLTDKEIKRQKNIKKIKKNIVNTNEGLQKNIKHTVFNIKDNIAKEKNERIFNEDGYVNPIKSKKFKVISAISIVVFLLLIGRIGWLQFIDGKDLKEKADRQQTINKIISPKRGNIYDANGVALALSASVDTVTINPAQIKDINNDDEKTKLLKENVAKGLSDIFGLDYNETYAKVTSKNSIETIAKKVEQDKIEQLKTWMSNNKVTTGINIDEDNKRYYPYSTLAANLIGFTGTDNSGLEGVEAQWNSTLAGTSGKIVTSKDINDSEISSNTEQYIQAEDGSDIVLSLDVNVQSSVEKVIAQYVNENQCDSGCGIIMNPKTGDILAMASYPSYDLNNPFTPNSQLAKTWDGLSESARYNALLKMWRNKAVSDTYEPGSTFKVIVSAIALEENLVATDTPGDFYCSGSEIIGDTEIHCWKHASHGAESLRQALENSCNPAFMQLGKRIGVDILYKYFDAFGLFDKTGIDTSGESSSVFFDKSKVGPTELATMSFGQRFNITPIQLITAVSSIANDGKLVKPRVVKQVVGKDSTTNIATTEVRQTVSEETASKVRSMMESVVTDGTGKYGSVKGYSIGGKTGTSEPSAGKENEGYVVSYVAIAPVEDPELVGLVIFYNPGGDNPEGGKLAGPAMSQILSEVLPYLGISNNSTENTTTSSITVPDVTNKTVAEAKKVLENIGLSVKLGNVGDQNSELVKEQVPKAGSSLLRNGVIKLYGNDNTRTSISVPNLKGKSLADARNTLIAQNLNISYEGSGTVISQTPSYTTSVEEGSIIKVVLADELKEAH